MEEENPDGQISELPLHSDFERLGNLLTKAQDLAQDNNNYDPAVIRDYFSVLYELFRFMYPVVRGREKIETLKQDLVFLNKQTMRMYAKLLSDKSYRVPSSIFDALSILHQDLLVIKQEANLGIKIKVNMTGKKKLQNVLE